MRLRVERDALADAVAWAARTLPARPTLPVLAGLLLRTGPTGLTVSSFDYEVSTQVDVDVTVAEEGAALVPGRLLAEITRSLPVQPVEIVLSGSRLTVTCGGARFGLPTMPVDDYPVLPDLPAFAGTLGSDVFAAAAASVATAAGRDDTLPLLTGVRLEIDGDRLTMAATDRYRLAVRQLTWRPARPDIAATVLVPARTLADTAKTMSGTAEITVSMTSGTAGDGMVGFSAGGRRTTTRLLDGEFPKYQSLFPTSTAAVAEIPSAPLIEAVRRVSLVAPRNSPVRMSFSADGLLLEAGGGDEAQATESVDATFEGDDLTIAFNPGYLLDGLGALDSDTARFSFTTAVKPAVLTGKPTDSGDGDFRYLLMPVRLSS